MAAGLTGPHFLHRLAHIGRGQPVEHFRGFEPERRPAGLLAIDYQAEDRLKAARAALREHLVTVAEWRKLE